MKNSSNYFLSTELLVLYLLQAALRARGNDWCIQSWDKPEPNHVTTTLNEKVNTQNAIPNKYHELGLVLYCLFGLFMLF
jgi:Gpi18-like mannosyltransferase